MNDLINGNGLFKYHFKKPLKQLNAIWKFIS